MSEQFNEYLAEMLIGYLEKPTNLLYREARCNVTVAGSFSNPHIRLQPDCKPAKEGTARAGGINNLSCIRSIKRRQPSAAFRRGCNQTPMLSCPNDVPGVSILSLGEAFGYEKSLLSR